MISDIVKEKIISDVKALFESQEGSHDWLHVYRVIKMAEEIGKTEKGSDSTTVFLASILHDVADRKLQIRSLDWIKKYLVDLNIDKNIIEEVLFIVEHLSFSKQQNNPVSNKSIEFKIVQDADRLDAIGAIGIARAFAFGGSKNRALYSDKEEDNDSTLHHFYQKLFKLEDLMETIKGKELAKERTAFMDHFVQTIKNECYLIK
ncbi:HD domain-containing protein [Halosquirtibacter laminarini]|uniref:HD domain-containing protein n=1 Tax=Halosquirtibacter laminarini TaxID=3374600 RepID=A0AC61NIZ5_9BACT|nr:HD domain-containing protein [Prolixibacteraceae bacterium]